MRQRRFALLAVTALIAAVMSPLLVAAPAQAAQVTGTMEKSYINYWGPEWVDATISDDFTVGVYYEETLVLPATRPLTFYDANDPKASIPAGMSVVFPGSGDYNGTGEVVLKGTPTTASASTKIVLAFNGYAGDEMWLTFDPVVIKAAPTTTTVTSATFSPYTAVNLVATVSPAPATGDVKFFLDSTLVGTSPAVAGVASYTGAVPTSFVGSSPVVTAEYAGADNIAASTSTSDPTVFIWGSRVFGGTFTKNGVGLAGENIDLLLRLTPTSLYYTGMVATTNASGAYQFDVGIPSTLAEAQAGYVIWTQQGYLYSVNGGVNKTNIYFPGDATDVTQATWGLALNIYVNVRPTWVDQTLAQPRLGEAYSDGVTASTEGTPTTLTYSTTGDFPSWMSLGANGAVTGGVPTDQNAHTFTVQVKSTYGTTAKEFTLTAADAWIPPSFTDSTVAPAQAGVYLDDEVLATGDGTISYEVSGGTLPAWLTLGADGSISGTPPLSAAGASYSFTVKATGYGTATVLVASVVAAAPTVGLDLDFAVGDIAVGSAFDFEVTGAGDAVPYSVTINSVPYVAANGFTSALGTASGTATVQSTIGAGAHSIVLTTFASDGTPRSVTVWFTVLADGRIGAISLSGPLAFIDLAALASTGSTLTTPLAAALLLLLTGLFVLRRRLKQP